MIDKVHPYVCILYQTRNSKHHVDFYVANLQENELYQALLESKETAGGKCNKTDADKLRRGTVQMVADGPLVALSLPRPAGDAGISLIVDNGGMEKAKGDPRIVRMFRVRRDHVRKTNFSGLKPRCQHFNVLRTMIDEVHTYAYFIRLVTPSTMLTFWLPPLVEGPLGSGAGRSHAF